MAHSVANPAFWTGFVLIVLVLLAFDLGVFHRRQHAVSVREALAWSVAWVALSLLFGLYVYYRWGPQKGLEFLAGYLIEYALSVDNVFVFVVIFSYFSVPARLHHRVLFWGVLGALVMRFTFIVVGAALIHAFHWILYVFGAFLVFTGFKLLRQRETKVDPQHNPVVRLFQRWIPLVPAYHDGRFFVLQGRKRYATPLALVLITVETTDVVFALDSIPAIFAVSQDPFIVYTSNVCAILGLRTMYFLLAAVVDRFVYLSVGLGVVLMFVGVKMLLGDLYNVPIGPSLVFVAAVLVGSVIWSLVSPPRPPSPPPSTPESSLIRSPPDAE